MDEAGMVTFADLPPPKEAPYDELFMNAGCPEWHSLGCFTDGKCSLKPQLPPTFTRKDTMLSRMDMAIYQAVYNKPIYYRSKISKLIPEDTIVHPIMPMDRIMALISAGVNPAFKRRTGEDAMLAALVNKRLDIVDILHQQHGVAIVPSTIHRYFHCISDNSTRKKDEEFGRLQKENDMLKSEVLSLKRERENLQSDVADLKSEVLILKRARDESQTLVDDLKVENDNLNIKKDLFMATELKLKEYTDIEEDLPEDIPPAKLRKMLAKAIRDTELSYKRVKETEATMYTMFEAPHGRRSRRTVRESMSL